MIPFLCPKCSSVFSAVESQVCVRCGFVFGQENEGKKICSQCFNAHGYFRKARAFGVYDGALKEVVHVLKYMRKIQLAKPLGMLVFSAFVQHWKDMEPDIVLPVPLHKNRFRERGFNQAYVLFKDWPKFTRNFSLRISESQIYTKILVRSRKTLSQVGMSREQRRKNIKDAFVVSAPEKVRGKSVLIVDDVFTTGATVEECARVLVESGAKYVDVLTIARAVIPAGLNKL